MGTYPQMSSSFVYKEDSKFEIDLCGDVTHGTDQSDVIARSSRPRANIRPGRTGRHLFFSRLSTYISALMLMLLGFDFVEKHSEWSNGCLNKFYCKYSWYKLDVLFFMYHCLY